MDFSVEFYETRSGGHPVQNFLDDLKQSDPGDFAAVMSGLAKLRNRQYTARLCPNLSEMIFSSYDMLASLTQGCFTSS